MVGLCVGHDQVVQHSQIDLFAKRRSIEIFKLLVRSVYHSCLLSALDYVGVVGCSTLQAELDVETVPIPVQRPNGARVVRYGFNGHSLQAILLSRREACPTLNLRHFYISLFSPSCCQSGSLCRSHRWACGGTRKSGSLWPARSCRHRRHCRSTGLGLGGLGRILQVQPDEVGGLDDRSDVRLHLLVQDFTRGDLGIDQRIVPGIQHRDGMALKICMATCQHQASVR
mmetsp:Transcript_56395/g.134636  ORF Transcript_56395/g.134636 Transcript_56395/m.134636 type:complete len:227 (-) Transcript_56395:313-993(-)